MFETEIWVDLKTMENNMSKIKESSNNRIQLIKDEVGPTESKKNKSKSPNRQIN